MSRYSNAISQAASAFVRARGKAFLRKVLLALQGQPNNLLPYDAVRRAIRAGMPNYRGVQTVPLDRIVGSMNRYRDFDRAFLPTQNHTAARWRRIGELVYADVNLPPVTLVRVGEVYFVVDGNHRVSVARELGRDYIDAEVYVSHARVPLTPDVAPGDIAIIGEKARFLEATRLDEARPAAQLDTTIPGGYHLLLEHITVHRWFQSQEMGHEVSEEQAAAHWHDSVYMPVVEVIRRTGILRDFPGRTETDLALWVSEHQFYLREHCGEGVSTQDAARSFANRFTAKPLKRLRYLASLVLPGKAGRRGVSP